MTLLAYYFPLIISVVVWAVVFILIRPQRIVRLLPVGILNVFYFFLIAQFLETTELAYYSPSFFASIRGTPVFSLAWAAGAAILMVHYIKKDDLSRKMFVVFIFTIIALVLDFVAVMTGSHIHTTNYSFIHSFLFMLAGNATFVIIAEGLFNDRIYARPIA